MRSFPGLAPAMGVLVILIPNGIGSISTLTLRNLGYTYHTAHQQSYKQAFILLLAGGELYDLHYQHGTFDHDPKN